MTVENGNLLSPNRTDNKLLAIWGIVVLAGIGVVVSGLGFWYRETILNGYHHAEEYVLSGLSLGLIPVVLWLAAFISASLIKRELFYKINLWIASIFGLVGILGVMSFFDIYFGSLSWATLGGKVSLGGKVGEVIAGPEDILGVIRVAAILIVALVVAMPTTVLFVARYLGRLLVFGYVILVLGVRKTGLFVRNINQGIYLKTGLEGPEKIAAATYFDKAIDESLKWVGTKGKFYKDSQRREVVDLFREGQQVYQRIIH